MSTVALCLNPHSHARPPLKGRASSSYTIREAAFQAYYPRERRVLKADRLAAEFKLDAAERIYRDILAADPQNAGAHNGLGKVLLARTTSSSQTLRRESDMMMQDAIQHFMTALRYQPGYAEARLNLARAYMHQERWLDAEEQIDQALTLAPKSSYAHSRKGECLTRQGKHYEALPYLQEAIRLDSGNSSAHLYLGAAHSGLGNLDEALDSLQIARYQARENPLVYELSAQVYQKQGNIAAAVEHYQKALLLKPELTESRLRLANLHEQRGDLTHALAHLKTLAESDPHELDAQMVERIGKLAIRNQQPDVAVSYYRRLQERKPDDPAVSRLLSEAKAEMAKVKLRDSDLISQGEARRYAEQAIRYEPDNIEARLIQAKLAPQVSHNKHAVTGQEPGMIDIALQQPEYKPYQAIEKGERLLSRYQFIEAEQAFRDALRFYGQKPKQQMILGELLLANGMPRLAGEAFRQVLKRYPDNHAALLGVDNSKKARESAIRLTGDARLHYRKGSRDVALLNGEEALRHDIRNAEAHYLLGQLHESRKDYLKAADHYYAYLQLLPVGDERRQIQRKIATLKKKAQQL